MSKRIVIIGAGRIGRTIAHLIQGAHPDDHLLLWDKNPQLVLHQVPLASSVPSADGVFVCTPSWTAREVLTELQPLIKATTPIITLAKGIEAVTGKTMAEVLDELFGTRHPHGVLGGPMLAEALEHGHRGIGVIGSTAPECREFVATVFAGTTVEIQSATQSLDVALLGCLKNVYAFIVGMTTGVDWSVDEQRRVFTKIRDEFLAVARALGLQDNVVRGPAGIGDFEETATSPSSHNHHCGADSAMHHAIVCSCEGTVSAPAIAHRLDNLKRFPLLDYLIGVLANQRPVQDINLFR